MRSDPAPPGYSQLSPQEVLAALDRVGLHGDGRILQLNSYENRVFQVFLEDGSAVVPKFYRPQRWSDAQILEEHTFAAELQLAEVPVVAPLLLQLAPDASGLTLQTRQAPTLATVDVGDQTHRFAVAPRCAGRSPELEAPGTLRRLGRFIGRLHAVGAAREFEHRYRMAPALDAARARGFLLDGDHLPPGQRDAWGQVSGASVTALERAFADLPPSSWRRLHGDCHLGNVLWRDEGPHVVDLDDACMGPAVQDLWMLVSGDASTMRSQLRELLIGYEEFTDFDDRELALIEPLRTLRMLRYSAWLAERWTDPAFPAAFPHFGTPAYWEQQTAQLREQLVLMGGGA